MSQFDFRQTVSDTAKPLIFMHSIIAQLGTNGQTLQLAVGVPLQSFSLAGCCIAIVPQKKKNQP